MSDGLSFFPPCEAVPVKQGDYVFYVLSMNSTDLLSIAYVTERSKNREGVQRSLDKKRLRAIGSYYQSTTRPGILPNNIIVSLSKDSFFKDGKLNIPQKKGGEAFVLDGQHRLFAFLPEYSGGKSIDLPVSAYIDLPDEMKAYVFRTINGEQRKINPSLVYDLVPDLRKDWVKFEDDRATTIVRYLNDDKESPWFDGIAMLGGRERPITQASFVTRIKSLFKKGNVFENVSTNDFYEEAIQIDLLVEYFRGASEVFPLAWKNQSYVLCKNTGVAAILNLLKTILADLESNGKELTNDQGLALTKDDFVPYLAKLRDISFGNEEYGSYLGESGIRELTYLLRQNIFAGKAQ